MALIAVLEWAFSVIISLLKYREYGVSNAVSLRDIQFSIVTIGTKHYMKKSTYESLQ